VLDLAVAAVLTRHRGSIDRIFAGFPAAAPGTDPYAGLSGILRAFRDVWEGNTVVVDRLPPIPPEAPTRINWRPSYLRGLIELRAGHGAAAADHFQRIIDHPLISATSPFHALAHVQQAHAHLLAGDTAKAAKAYEKFFAIWKDADPDVPLLIAAKAEYARLQK
jgi:hypothetical protein